MPIYKSLINDLSNLEQLNYIKSNKEFFNYAYCHAKKSGKKGYIGHSRKKSGCTNLPPPLWRMLSLWIRICSRYSS